MPNVTGGDVAPVDHDQDLAASNDVDRATPVESTPSTTDPVAPLDASTGIGRGEPEVAEPPVLSTRHLTKVFSPSPGWMKILLKSAITEPILALDDATFELQRGQTCVVVGPNGAGKSTLFRILTGLITPTSGEATILGRNIDEGRRVRALIGFMPAEDRNLMLRHTCLQNLEFRGRLQAIPRDELGDGCHQVLDLVGLGEVADRAATSLSTGMKARLQLAAALLHRPEFLILDEPTSTVDPVGAHELLTLIEDLTHSEGLTILLSSHRLEEIDALHNKVVFLDHGRIIHNGNLRDLRTMWEQARFRIEFSEEVDVTELGRRLDREADFEIDVIDAVLEIGTDRPVGDVMAALGPAVNGIVAFDKVVMPLRVLFHKLVTGEIEGEVQ